MPTYCYACATCGYLGEKRFDLMAVAAKHVDSTPCDNCDQRMARDASREGTPNAVGGQHGGV